MIPSKFEYLAPKSVDEAVALLGRHGADAKLLAGGHSLIPLMKLRLASPSVLIDLGRVRDLRYIREEGDEVAIGGMTTYSMLESSPVLQAAAPLVAEATSRVGDVQVRNRGTVGGSLVHADPAADLPAAVLALEATMRVVGPNGARTIPAGSFFVDMLQTAVGADEILTEVRVRKALRSSGSAYMKVPQAASGFALVGVGCYLEMSGSKCKELRIGVTGVAAKPFRAAAVEGKLRGSALDEAALRAACAGAADGVDALSDIHASGDYRKDLAAVYTRRAIETAAARARA